MQVTRKKVSKLITFLLIWLLLPLNAQANTVIDTETPWQIWEIADKYGEEYGICPELILAVCYQESRYQTDAVSAGGDCFGIMQIQAKSHTARMKRLGVTNLLDADQCVHVGTDYLAELFEQYEDVGIVLGIYHGEKTAFTKTSNYTLEILERSYNLETLHGKHDTKGR